MASLWVLPCVLLISTVIAQSDLTWGSKPGLPNWLIELEKRKNHTGTTPQPPPPPPPPLGDENSECPSDVIHDRLGNQGYFFSWVDERSKNLKLNWQNAVRFCRARCLELVSVETWTEENYLASYILKGQQTDVWTSGRKCDFSGCDQPELQPADIYGWFWEGSHTQLPPTTDRFDVNWSETGELGEPQPDNNSGKQGGEEESCLAILNNFYNDGVRWHDEPCSQRRSFICEERTRWSPSNPKQPSKPSHPNRPNKHRPSEWAVVSPKSDTFQYRLIP